MDYLWKNLDEVAELAVEHLGLVAVSLLVSVIIAVPIAALITKFKKLQPPVIGFFSVVYTIPSLALFAYLIPILGLGKVTAVTCLVVYTQMILVRNMVAGIKGIDPLVLEAARGMGMGPWRMFRKVTFPLALPVLIAGIRSATVWMIGTATLAAFINAGGLGELVFEGIYQDHFGKIIAGTIAVAVLAVAAEISLRLLEWRASLHTK